MVSMEVAAVMAVMAVAVKAAVKVVMETPGEVIQRMI